MVFVGYFKEYSLIGIMGEEVSSGKGWDVGLSRDYFVMIWDVVFRRLEIFEDGGKGVEYLKRIFVF